jgi:hypothetical protein
MSKYRPALKVQKPCNEAWEEMAGNDQVRFCGHCSKHVNNISELSRKDAMRLAKRSGGNICVRYVQDPVTKQPLFARDLYQISRRAPRLAAGVLGAALTCASSAYSQQGELRESVSETRIFVPGKAEHTTELPEGTSRISGIITDKEGNVVPGISVFIKENQYEGELRTTSGADGSFAFEGLPAGTYSLRTYSQYGFLPRSISNIRLGDADAYFSSIQVELETIVMGIIAFSPTSANGEAVERSELAEAVYSEILEDVLELLARGADPNEADEDGDTPLFMSVEDGTFEIAKALMDFGASAKTINKAGKNVLFLIDDDTTVDMVKMLIAYGADVNHKLEDGTTPLIYAAEHGKPEVVKALIDAGADVNAADEEGWTPLMKAAWEECVDKVRMLLKAGANVNARNKNGETAWDQAAEEEVEKLLESYGAIIDDDDDDDH